MAFITAAAIGMAGLSAVQGLYVQQERFPWYYDHAGIKRSDFYGSNSVASAAPSKRVRSFEPSVAQRTLIGAIDFKADYRDVETRIFRGLITPGTCSDGVYIFRVTSDDAAHLLLDGKVAIDNGGAHGPKTVYHGQKLTKGQNVQFELWWGNAGGPSSLHFEYCKKNPSGLKEDPLSVEEGELAKAAEGMTDEELAASGCVWTTDLSELFLEHEGPVVKRCDFKGKHYDGMDWLDNHADGTLDKFLPEKCAYELGGWIGANAKNSGNYQATDTTVVFTALISPRVTGLHTFWTLADDGCFVVIKDRKGKKTQVVDNSGWHAPEWKHGSITLDAAEAYELTVYWGNAGYTGKLKVMFEDALTEGHAWSSINSILLPAKATF